MAMQPETKHVISSYEDDSLSDVSSPDEEKTIPFLRRLRDMLIENRDVISFAPGNRTASTTVLGRIVVHDRVEVEGKVLPRYFNHSSFASLRRQLNYFMFIRVGKGRQKESIYINENVVELDDILHLKRRPTTGQALPSAPKETALTGMNRRGSNGKAGRDTFFPSNCDESNESLLEHRSKRRRQSNPPTVSPRSDSPVEANPISEDEHCPRKNDVVDLTRPDLRGDADFMAGCKNLLCLASKRWE